MKAAYQSTTPHIWHALDVAEVTAALKSDTVEGLTGPEARQRLDVHGPNSLPQAPEPSGWAVALAILKDPMNLLLAVTAIVGIVVGQPDTAVLVAILVGLNVVLGTRQELAAHASVKALDTAQVPVTRVRRGGTIEELEATALVPGDLLLIEGPALALERRAGRAAEPRDRRDRCGAADAGGADRRTRYELPLPLSRDPELARHRRRGDRQCLRLAG